MTTLTLASGATIEIDEELYMFVKKEVVPGTGKSADEVFSLLGELVVQFDPKNQELCAISSNGKCLIASVMAIILQPKLKKS